MKQPTASDLAAHFASLNDEALLDVFETPDEYTDDALAVARREAARRGLEAPVIERRRGAAVVPAAPLVTRASLAIAVGYSVSMFVFAWCATPSAPGSPLLILGFFIQVSTALAALASLWFRRTRPWAVGLALGLLLSYPACVGGARAKKAWRHGRLETRESDSLYAQPFMEHPTGKHRRAVDAMEDAIGRLRALPKSDRWIRFTAQGDAGGGRARRVSIRVLNGTIDVGKAVDPERIVSLAGVKPAAFVPSGDHYSSAGATPKELAQVLDVLFRHELGIRPFADEGDDYAVGAEW